MFMQELAREGKSWFGSFLHRGTMSSSSTTLGVRIYWRRIETAQFAKRPFPTWHSSSRTSLSNASLATVPRGNALRKRNQPTNCYPTRLRECIDLRDLSIDRFFHRGFGRWLRNRSSEIGEKKYRNTRMYNFLFSTFLRETSVLNCLTIFYFSNSHSIESHEIKFPWRIELIVLSRLRSCRSHVDLNLIEFRCISEDGDHVGKIILSNCTSSENLFLPSFPLSFFLPFPSTIYQCDENCLDLPYIHVIGNACLRRVQYIVYRSPHILYLVSGYRVIAR